MTHTNYVSALSDQLAGTSLLARVAERNPGLLNAAVQLHHDGKVPANSWLIHLDTVAADARLLATSAARLGLSTYTMTKQYARNADGDRSRAGQRARPGSGRGCAVHSNGAPLRHPGRPRRHLNQVPRAFTNAMLAHQPEIVTVFTVKAADGDPAAICRMPGGVGLRTEVVIHRAHRIPCEDAAKPSRPAGQPYTGAQSPCAREEADR